MATYSSRAGQLAEQRSGAKTYSLFSGSRKVLAPKDSSVDSIARKTVTSQIDSMVSRYNNGEVTNDDMLNLLSAQQNNPTLTNAERLDLVNKIKDFNVLIKKDRLEAVFKAAPDKSLTQIQAAQALSKFYTDRASGMMTGTPAQSQSLENAAVWNQKVTDVQTAIDKDQRTKYRLEQLKTVASIVPNTTAEIQAKAQAYQNIANDARADGADTEAIRYETLAQQEMTSLPAAQTKEQKAQIAKNVSDWEVKISKLKDRSPSEIDAKKQMALDIAQQYYNIGDQLGYNKYTAMANEMDLKLSNMYAANGNLTIKKEIQTVYDELSQARRAYTYGTDYTTSDGQKIQIDAPTLSFIETSLFTQLADLIDKGMYAGIKGLENDARTIQDELAKAKDTTLKLDNQELVETVNNKGKKTLVNITDPDTRAKYVESGRFWYPLETPKSQTPGSTGLTPLETQNLVDTGRAYYLRDSQGNTVNKAGDVIMQDENGVWRKPMADPTTGQYMLDDKGQPMLNPIKVEDPRVVPEQYVDIKTAKGTERVWSKHDETGQPMGWYPETGQIPDKYTPAPYTSEQYQGILNAPEPVSRLGQPFNLGPKATPAVNQQAPVTAAMPGGETQGILPSALPKTRSDLASYPGVTPNFGLNTAPVRQPAGPGQLQSAMPLLGTSLQSTPQYKPPAAQTIQPLTAMDISSQRAAQQQPAPASNFLQNIIQPVSKFIQPAVKTVSNIISGLGQKLSKFKFW